MMEMLLTAALRRGGVGWTTMIRTLPSRGILAIPHIALLTRRTASMKAAVSPEESAEKRMVDDLTRIVKAINANQPHYCSGTLDLGPVELYLKSRPTADGEGEGSAAWLNFPPSPEAMEMLVKACEPASFGLGSKDVYDPTYRSALKLNPDEFAISNDPRSFLVEKVTAILTSEDRGFISELYKLNVYGPGDHFKAHVDSPRSDTMFGSLVVCLPSAHTGGQLVLTHHGRKKVFDWSGDEAANRGLLQWAAFYSDVQHEILPVETGYRVTLTYNLYWPDTKAVAAKTATALPRLNVRTPILEALTSQLTQPEFLPEGGFLGFCLSHDYPITDKGWRDNMHLKGADNAILEAARTLGLETELNAVFDIAADEYHYFNTRPANHDEDENVDGYFGWDYATKAAEPSLRPYGSSFYWTGKFERLLLVSKDFKGRKSDLKDEPRVSTEFEALTEGAGAIVRDDVIWCTYPNNLYSKEAMATPYYGNDGSTHIYVSAALFVKIPLWEARRSD
ncbi:hypothetical protein HK101_001807 [Irineochytrium annulatum]|nr:hypothetical protein HK101_001807 [Irineochytrium annulatum]